MGKLPREKRLLKNKGGIIRDKITMPYLFKNLGKMSIGILLTLVLFEQDYKYEMNPSSFTDTEYVTELQLK